MPLAAAVPRDLDTNYYICAVIGAAAHGASEQVDPRLLVVFVEGRVTEEEVGAFMQVAKEAGCPPDKDK